MEGGEQEESSAQRRERLLALRSNAAAAAAAAASAPSSAPPPPPPGTAWDLPAPDLVGAGASAARPPTRFDYYTNPAAAFASSHKRKTPPPTPTPTPRYAGSGNYGGGYHPPHQHHMGPSPIHSPSQMAPDSPASSPWRSPMPFQNPMPGYRGPPPGAPPPWSPHSASPAQGPYPHSPNFGYRNSNIGQGGSPMNYGPRGGPYPSHGQGRGQDHYVPRGSPYPSHGRGRGQDHYGDSGSRGRGGRGGFGSQNNSGRQDRRSYYSKSMTDDPWRGLQPIVGEIGSKSSWLPESLRAKKNTSDDRGQIKPKPGLSLSEYLDLSFNEASNDT